MKRILPFTIALMLLSVTEKVVAQNGLIGAGFSTGWSNPSNITYMSGGVGTSRIVTRNPSGTGNQYFRPVRGWSGNNNEMSPSAGCVGGADQVITMNTTFTAQNTNCTNGAYYFNCPNTSDNYVFKTPDGAGGTSFVVFRVQGTVQSISSVAQAPTSSNVYPGQAVTVTATLSGSLSTGQGVYLRYTTNAYSTSTVVQMTGSGTSYSASIPATANTPSAVASYYVFTSGDGNCPASDGSNADFYTINLNNNSGSNYGYTVKTGWTSAATGNWSTAATWTANAVPSSTLSMGAVSIGHAVTMDQSALATSLALTASTLTTNGGNTLSIASGGTVSSSGGDFNPSSAGTLAFLGSGTVSGTVNFYPAVTIAGGVDFGTGSTIRSTLQINSGGYVNNNAPTYGAASTLKYNTTGTYGRHIEWSATSAAGYPNNVQISNNTTLDLGANSGTATARQCAGNLTIDDGSTFTMNNSGDAMTAALTVLGNITIGGGTSGTFVQSGSAGGDLYVYGNWTRNSGGTLTTNGRAVFFGGSTPQQLTGTTTFDYLFISNATGLTLNSPAIVNTNLTLTSGNITLGSNNLTLNSSASITGGTSSSYIVTNGTGFLVQPIANAYKLFPVGTATSYAPTSLNQAGTAENLSVRVSGTITNAVNDATQIVTLQWTINESVTGANNLLSKFQWNTGNEAGSFVRTGLVYQGNWNGTDYSIRSSTVSGSSSPYLSTSTANYTGNLSNQTFVVGDVAGLHGQYCTTTSGDWNSTSTWAAGVVPPTDAVICVSNALTVNSVDPANITTLVLNSGGSLNIASGRTLNIDAGGSITNNSSTASLGNGTIVFAGSGSIAGSQASTLNNLTLNGATTLTTTPTINGTLQLNSGTTLTGTPSYGSASTLVYNEAVTVGSEWTGNSSIGSSITAGSGIPNNVTVQANVTMPTSARAMAGNLLISSSTLALSTTSGADLYLGGNWTRNGGSFTPNGRAVIFQNSATATISITGGGTETFNYLILDKASNNLVLNSSPATSITVSGSTGDPLQLLNNGSLDLNGQTLNLTNTGGNIKLSGGARNIIGAANSTINVQGHKYTTSASGGTITYGSNVTLNLTDGLNFGSSLSTVNGTLKMSNNGFDDTFAPTYGSGSTLQYSNTGTYVRTTEWGTTSGAGYPYNVIVSNGGVDLSTCPGNLGLAGKLTVASGTTLNMNGLTHYMSVGGDIQIDGTLTLGGYSNASNVGDLYVSGNWSRTGTFNANSRAVYLQGTGSATITASGGESFPYLFINKTGGATVTLANDINVSNRFDLGSGMVTTGSNKVNVTSNAASAVTGYSTTEGVITGYVNGYLKRAVTASTSYDFPIGTSAQYELANITFDGGLTGTTNLTANFNTTFIGSAPDTSSCVINESRINGYLNYGFWTITPDVQPTGGTYTASIHERGYSNAPSAYGTVTAASQMGLIKRANNSDTWKGCGNRNGIDQGYGTHSNSTQTIASGSAVASRSGISSFSDFSVGINSQSDPLPIELISFTAEKLNNDGLLKWSTAVEINNNRFDIERSTDGINFDAIAEVNGHGTSTIVNNYSYTDFNMAMLNVPVVYYRLKQVDNDGHFVYSYIVYISLSTNAEPLTVLSTTANPFTDYFAVNYLLANSDNMQIALFDIRGALVSESDFKADKGLNKFELPSASNLIPGIYILNINSSNKMMVYKITKLR